MTTSVKKKSILLVISGKIISIELLSGIKISVVGGTKIKLLVDITNSLDIEKKISLVIGKKVSLVSGKKKSLVWTGEEVKIDEITRGVLDKIGLNVAIVGWGKLNKEVLKDGVGMRGDSVNLCNVDIDIKNIGIDVVSISKKSVVADNTLVVAAGVKVGVGIRGVVMNGNAIVVVGGRIISVNVSVENDTAEVKTVKSIGIEVSTTVGVKTLIERDSSEVGKGIKRVAVLVGVNKLLDVIVKISVVSTVIVLIGRKKEICVLSIPKLKSISLVSIENVALGVFSAREGVGVINSTIDVGEKLNKLDCSAEVKNCEEIAIGLLSIGVLENNTVDELELKLEGV